MMTQGNTETLPDAHTFMVWFYGKYSNYLYKMAWQHCKDSHEVDELVQSVWVKLCEKADVLSALSCPRQLSYIAATIRNTAISLSRKAGTECSLEAVENILCNESDILIAMIDRKLRVERFREVWPQIPAGARELLERKYLLMESDEEIADSMGIGRNSVRTYLSRARRTACAFLMEYKEELV